MRGSLWTGLSLVVIIKRMILLSLILTLAVGSESSVARAHLDPPGPPPIETEVNILDVKDFVLRGLGAVDDGIDGNNEFLLAVTVIPENHVGTQQTFEIDNLNFDVTDVWNINSTIWTHLECTPRDNVIVRVALVELDNGSKEILTSAILSITRLHIHIALVAAGTAGPVGLAVAAATAGVPIIVTALNGHDDLGTAAGNLFANGLLPIRTDGPDGGATITIQDVTTALVDTGQCTILPSPPPPPSTPPETGEDIFGPLEDATEKISTVASEPGNPARLTDEQLECIRMTLLRMTLGLAEAMAGAAIEDARELQGVEDAIRDFEAAQMSANIGDPTKAITEYKSAFIKAATSRSNGIPGPEIRLPFQVSLTTDFLSTEPQRHAEVLVPVFGAVSPAGLTISGQPPGIQTEITRIAPGVPVFTIKLDIGDVQPGTYSLQVSADDGLSETSREMTLKVNPRVTAVGGVSSFLADSSSSHARQTDNTNQSAGTMTALVGGLIGAMIILILVSWYARRRRANGVNRSV